LREALKRWILETGDKAVSVEVLMAE